ncbi:class I SAM-dependent methyltransferase [Halomarina pelagica]|uniref:class I SAM-dependent methyltransferase n=1 Tax=Halomarina pelagica TaxID=2961599 RepID=UPI0020C3360F|nr:class I SAM-dependent methyltransferase [Halomarina sp. BND7]
MSVIDRLLWRTFGRPRGLLGRLGGRILARGKGEVTEWVISGLDLRPTDRVVEVGFGPGLGVRLAAAAVPEGFVAGVDYSEVMVEQARARNAAAVEDGRVDLRYGSADDLPFADAAFDGAFSINSMQTWPDAAAGLRELHRVLKPGGRLALAFTPVAGQSTDELRPLLSEAGFGEIRIEERDGDVRALATK